MTKCPRCLTNELNEEHTAMNSLSRRDNDTYICNECGNEEAFVDIDEAYMSEGVAEREIRMKKIVDQNAKQSMIDAHNRNGLIDTDDFD